MAQCCAAECNVLLQNIIDHPRSGVVYIFAGVAWYVCMPFDNYLNPCPGKFINGVNAHPSKVHLKFMYQGRLVRVKVTAKSQNRRWYAFD